MTAAFTRGLGLVVVIGLLVGASAGLATDEPRQAPIDVLDQGCGACGITYTHVVTLGTRTGPIARRPSSVIRTSAGRFLVIDDRTTAADSLISVFRSDGSLERHLTRKGVGPGEMELPRLMTEFGRDSILSVEANKMNLYDGRLRFLRSIPTGRNLPLAGPMVALSNGLIAVRHSGGGDTVIFLRPTSGNSPVKLNIPQVPGRTGPRANVFLLQLANATSPVRASVFLIQTDNLGDLLIRQIDTVGKLLSLHHRRLDWWYNYSQGMQVMGGAPSDTVPRPNSSLKPAAVNGDVVFLLANHSRADWVRVGRDDAVRRAALTISVVEVVNIRTSRLVGRVEIPGYGISVMANGMVASYREDADGIPYVDILQLQLPRE